MSFSVPGLAPKKAKDKRAYTSILYGNGPGYSIRDGARPDASLPAAGTSLLRMWQSHGVAGDRFPVCLLGTGWRHRVAEDNVPLAWPQGPHRVLMPP